MRGYIKWGVYIRMKTKKTEWSSKRGEIILLLTKVWVNLTVVISGSRRLLRKPRQRHARNCCHQFALYLFMAGVKWQKISKNMINISFKSGWRQDWTSIKDRGGSFWSGKKKRRKNPFRLVGRGACVPLPPPPPRNRQSSINRIHIMFPWNIKKKV